MKNKVILGIITIIGILGIIILTQRDNDGNQTFYETYGLEATNTVSMVETFERLTLDRNEFNIVISATTLTIQTNGAVYTHAVPINLFYLSFAPYINNTHPCGIHNLVTCRGELKNETFDVLITNNEGDIIYQDTVTSEDNGFKGIWLPRNMEGTITVDYDGLTASASISTYDDSNTCLTTVHLQ